MPPTKLISLHSLTNSTLLTCSLPIVYLQPFPSLLPSPVLLRHLAPFDFFSSWGRNALTSTDCRPFGPAASVSLITAIGHGKDVRAKSKQISWSEETPHHRYAHNKVQLVQACQLAQCHSHRCNSALWLYPGLLGLTAVENGLVRGCLLLHDRSWYHRR